MNGPETKIAYAPMPLGPRARFGLIVLRVFLTITTALAVFAFVQGLRAA